MNRGVIPARAGIQYDNQPMAPLDTQFFDFIAALPYHGIPRALFSFRLPFGGRELIELRYYTIIYAGGFVLAWLLLRKFRREGQLAPLTDRDVTRFVLWMLVCVVLGARVVYIVFYNPWLYLALPLKVFSLSGLSFHGGLLGVALGAWWYARKHALAWPALADALALIAPLALGFGRVGNFLNGELYGRASDLPWAMRFPAAHGRWTTPRHPSQIYEALTEGLLLALLLWSARQRVKRPGALAALFVLGYGAGRFAVEFTRQPDPQLGLVLGPFSMGQLLSGLMVVAGAVWLWRLRPLGGEGGGELGRGVTSAPGGEKVG